MNSNSRSGWFKIDNALVETAPAKVGCVAWTVYTILLRHADADGRCWPSIERIAQMIGKTRRTVQTALAALETAGLIKRDGRPGLTNYFFLSQTCAIGCAPPKETCEADCAPPAQLAAQGGEADCAGGVKPVAHEEDPIRKTQEQHPVKKTQRAAKGAVLVEIPKEIDSEPFRAAWASWHAHKAATGKKLPETTQRLQLKKLASWGTASAIAAIEQSIANNWTGLFEPKENSNGKPSNRHADSGVYRPGQVVRPIT